MFIISKFIVATLWQHVLWSWRWWCRLSKLCRVWCLTLKCVKMLSLWSSCHTQIAVACRRRCSPFPCLSSCQLQRQREREREREIDTSKYMFFYIYDASSQSNIAQLNSSHTRSISFSSQFKKSFQVSCFNKFPVKVFRISPHLSLFLNLSWSVSMWCVGY